MSTVSTSAAAPPSFAEKRAALRAKSRQMREGGDLPTTPSTAADRPVAAPPAVPTAAPTTTTRKNTPRSVLPPLQGGGLLGPAQRVVPVTSPVKADEEETPRGAADASPSNNGISTTARSQIRVMPQKSTSPTPSDQANSLMKRMRMTTPPSSTIGNGTSTNMFTATGNQTKSLVDDDDFSASQSSGPRPPFRLSMPNSGPSSVPLQPSVSQQVFHPQTSSYSASQQPMHAQQQGYTPSLQPQQQPAVFPGSWSNPDNNSQSSLSKSDQTDSHDRPNNSVYPLEVPGILRSAPLSGATPPGYRPPDLRQQVEEQQQHPHQTASAQQPEQHQTVAQSSYHVQQQQQASYPPLSPYQPPVGINNFCSTTQECNGRSYLVLEMIGRGGSSRVFRVIGTDRKIYALKKVRVGKGDIESLNSYANEIQLLQKLRGKQQIVQLIDAEIRHANSTIYMVLESGDTDLAKVLAEKRTDSLSPLFMQLYWQQMLEAVHIIHEERIVHGDLKPANFVMVQGSLKLIDFGIAKAIQSDDTTRIVRDAAIGTPNYMSPEAINSGQDAKYKLGRQSDIWSLGCILYQMVYGKTPFADLPIMAKMKTIADPSHKIEYPVGPGVTDHLRRTLQSCLQPDPTKRATIPDLLKVPFVELSRTHAVGSRRPPSHRPPDQISPDFLQRVVREMHSLNISTADVLQSRKSAENIIERASSKQNGLLPRARRGTFL